MCLHTEARQVGTFKLNKHTIHTLAHTHRLVKPSDNSRDLYTRRKEDRALNALGKAKIRRRGIILKLQQKREAEDEGGERARERWRERKREGWASEPRVTREDMLQIKSFGTKEDCCQATQPEQGYQGNRGDPKLDLRNGVTLVVHRRTHTQTHTHTHARGDRNTDTHLQLSLSLPCSLSVSLCLSLSLSLPIAFKVHTTNTNRQRVSSGKRWTRLKCHPVAQTKKPNKKQGFQSRGVIKLRRGEVTQLMDDGSQNQQLVKHNAWTVQCPRWACRINK